MGKLGKKARKFAKKNLQSVQKHKRKTNVVFKKRSSSSSKNGRDNTEQKPVDKNELANGRNVDAEDVMNTSLDAVFTEDDSDMGSDGSDSDGFLSEDSSSPVFMESEIKENVEENSDISALTIDNRKILVELTIQKKKLNKLKKKDPKFVKFLESYNESELFQNEEMHYSDEEETSNHGKHLENGNDANLFKGKLVTSPAISSWSQLVTEEHSESALKSLLNAYRSACHLGTESTGLPDAAAPHIIHSSDAFCNISMFILCKADNIFRDLLKIPASSCKKETILEMKNTSKWKKVKSLVKSYLRSTLFLLKQATDSEILAFSLTRLRASMVFFAAFPSLLRRLLKIVVPLWATGGGTLSSCSFLIIRDLASLFSSNCFDSCLIKSYKAYIARCRNLETVEARHIEFLGNSFVELCSLDVPKTCSKALLSIQQLGYIFRQALKKEKEAITKICSWQYAKCLEVWVLFISANIRDHDIQSLCYTTIQLVNGVANLFPGPRYFLLRVKCIQWLNKLSSSSGIFIPVTSLVLDILEYKLGQEGGKPGKAVNYSSLLKLPKYWLKSPKFKEDCVFSAIELLSVHFMQWSYHISFPELATTPVIQLKKFHEITAIERLRSAVKRMIDQLEQNAEFVQKKRDEVAFSPKDHEAAELFLQSEKGSRNAPFAQYYRSVVEKAVIKCLMMNDKQSLSQQKSLKRKRKRGQFPDKVADGGSNTDSDKKGLMVKVDSETKRKRASKARAVSQPSN